MKDSFNKICMDASLVGASVVVYNKNGIVEEVCYGKQSIEENIETSKDTIYRLASISKVIVAASVMTLQEQHKICLDDDISNYLGFKVRNPFFPNDYITIRMLMTQTSSLLDGKDNSGYDLVNGTNNPCSLQDLLVDGGKYYTLDTFDHYKPGTNFNYSNFNCGILACIVEKVTGMYFTDYVRKNVLIPLEMDASFVITDIKNQDKVASLYKVENNNIKLNRTLVDFINLKYNKFPLGDNFRGPAGGLFSSLSDLAKFARIFLNNGRPILKKETTDLMLATHWEGVGHGAYKAKGLQMIILNYKGHILKGHFGDAYGVRSFMLFNEEKNIGINYITNGGFYKLQQSGIDSVQEKVLDLFIEKYM
ncbi:MAG TPA: beta-lactamase family protein [Acholeplasmataceae bacterium]|nr:beta-lactamase family protein [Acholeplasmataceae bacterium]